MLERIMDSIIVKTFGKYSLAGFHEVPNEEAEKRKKSKYVFESIFPDREIAKQQMAVVEEKN